MKIKKYTPELTAHIKGVGSPGGVSEASVGPAMAAIGQAAEAYRGLGESVGKLAGSAVQLLETIHEKKVEERRNREFTDLVTRTEEAWQTFQMDAEKWGVDPDDYVAAMKQGWDTIMEEQSKEVGDKFVKKAFQERMAKRWLQVLPGVANEAGKAWLDREAASKITQADAFRKLAAQAPTKVEYESHRQSMIDVYRSGNFIFGETKAKQLEITAVDSLKNERQLALKDRFAAVVIKNPTRAIEEAIRGDWDELEETDRLALVEKAKALQLHRVDLAIKQEERARTIGHRKESIEAYRLFATGQLTQNWLLQTKFLTGSDRHTWELRILERAKRGPVAKSEFKVWSALREHIPYIETSEDLEDFIKTVGEATEIDLTEEDAKKFIEQAMARAGGLENEAIKRAHMVLKAHLAPSADILGLPDVPEEREAYSKGMRILDDEIAMARKKGKPLTPEEIENRAIKIAAIPGLKVPALGKPGIIKEQLRREKERIKAEKEKAKREREGRHKKGKALPKLPGESLLEYYNRIGGIPE